MLQTVDIQLVHKVQKAIEFLNSMGYVVSPGRSNSPQLKLKGSKPKTVKRKS